MSPAEIAIFKPDRIGDLVLATGVIDLILKQYSDRPVTLFVSQWSSSLAQRIYPECNIVVLPHFGEGMSAVTKGFFALRKVLPNKSFGTVISLRHHLTAFEDLTLAGIGGKRSSLLGISGSGLGEIHWQRKFRRFKPDARINYPSEESDGYCRELEAHRLLAEEIAKRNVGINEVLPRLPNVVTEGEYIAVLPYGSNEIRTYPFDSLVESIAGASKILEVRICGEKSRELDLVRLRDLLVSKGCLNVTIEFPKDIFELCQVVAEAKLVISMESAGAHIAAALDKRCVTIIGGGHYGNFAPWRRSAKQEWLTNRLPCFNCDWNCIFTSSRCITEIPHETVSESIRRLLHI